MLDHDTLPPFFCDVLSHIRQCNFADLVLRVYGRAPLPTAPARPPSSAGKIVASVWKRKSRNALLWTLYQRLDARLSSKEMEILEPRDVSALLAGIPRIDVTPISKGFTHSFSPEVVEEIRTYELDILLRFGFNIIRGGILQAARYGVWSYHHGDNDFYRGGPACFWELVEHNPLTGTTLQILNDKLDDGTVLCKGLAPTNASLLVSKNRVAPSLLGTTFAIRKMFELHRGGMEELQAKSCKPAPYRGKQKIYRMPTNTQMARFLFRRLLGKTIRRPFRRPTVTDHWRIAFRASRRLSFSKDTGRDLSGFRWIESPRGHFYADPFLLEKNGRVYCFFEDYDYATKRGRISCGQVTPDCDLIDVRPVLAAPYHLSYPFVFEEQGELYFVPESAQNKTVDLYRCERFPDKWERIQTILNAPGLDTTIAYRDGLYWMFTTVSEPHGASPQLILLFSPYITGPYRLHPNTPLSTDARYARGAGRIFDRDGVLIRPSQDLSVTYGSALHFRKVVRLTVDEYKEESLVSLHPPVGFQGIHSYDRVGDVETLDCKRAELESNVILRGE